MVISLGRDLNVATFGRALLTGEVSEPETHKEQRKSAGQTFPASAWLKLDLKFRDKLVKLCLSWIMASNSKTIDVKCPRDKAAKRKVVVTASRTRLGGLQSVVLENPVFSPTVALVHMAMASQLMLAMSAEEHSCPAGAFPVLPTTPGFAQPGFGVCKAKCHQQCPASHLPHWHAPSHDLYPS